MKFHKSRKVSVNTKGSDEESAMKVLKVCYLHVLHASTVYRALVMLDTSCPSYRVWLI